MTPLTRSKNTTILLVLIALTLACFALSAQARAACQEGCLTNQNTVLGDDALVNNTTGVYNTATGVQTLEFNTTGNYNTSNGSFALLNNTTGFANTATGYNALVSNTTGTENTATGFYALSRNTFGGGNTADGRSALGVNTTGGGNTATGFAALGNNTTGSENTATGELALAINSTGNSNTAIGLSALLSNMTGSNNTAFGSNALVNNTIGNNNIGLGDSAGYNRHTGSNNIDIGNHGKPSESNTIRIGSKLIHNATFVAGISGAIVPTGVAVIVDTSGHLGTTTSSERFKEAIKPMDKASETILALKPVTFRYKKELDPDGITQFGLVAEDVEKVNPDLVARDEQGKPYSVRYEAVNAMLLNEFLKEHRKVESLEKAMAEQCRENAAMRAMLKEQATQIRKVSAQVEVSSSAQAPQMVNNH